jgi:hypothetical protein
MRAWTELKKRFDELRLTRVQREIAQHLIAGARTSDIVAAMGISEVQVKLCAAYLLYALRKQPPDAPIAVRPVGQPPRQPGGAGVALEVPR